MTLNVLIVDDSSFFQRQLKNIINEHPKLNVIGSADNGREAIEKVKKLKPDIVTMDYEMPMMDGVTAVRSIMAENPLPILMLSSMTYEGARITLDALDAGAMDFMTKDFSKISNNSPEIKKSIYEALLTIGEQALKNKKEIEKKTVIEKKSQDTPVPESAPSRVSLDTAAPVKLESVPKCEPIIRSSNVKPKIIVIGSSTGGPAALSELLKDIPASFSLPIIIVQHMPETFTRAFAERLNRQCKIEVKEAETGDEIKPGRALLAPGGKQLIINKNNIKTVKIIDSTQPVNYKPCVDITFASLSNTYGAETLGVVLTGMGNDGCDGARLLKQKGASIWTQTEESCLIYGMPMAVDQANLSDASLALSCISERFLEI
ncbi:MAG: protein-glutamate methylesterase/protein-glutamine glutaminase [Cellvibrionaceae bacterium]